MTILPQKSGVVNPKNDIFGRISVGCIRVRLVKIAKNELLNLAKIVCSSPFPKGKKCDII
jgi:hypothetical protein